MTDSKVTVAADELGSVMGISVNNGEYGYIRVQQVSPKIGKGGWLTYVKKSALIKGTVEDLKMANFREGDVLPGKIVVRESLTPFYLEDPDKHLKRAGASGIPCTLDDQPIYRECTYTTNMNEVDELIEHNNGDDIREHQLLEKEKESLRIPECKTSGLSGLRNLSNRQ